MGWQIKVVALKEKLRTRKRSSVQGRGARARPVGAISLRETNSGAPYGTRTRVPNVRGWCPRPLDERDSAAATYMSGMRRNQAP